MNEVGFEETMYTVSEDSGLLSFGVTLLDINLKQSSNEALGVQIVVTAGPTSGTAKCKSA